MGVFAKLDEEIGQGRAGVGGIDKHLGCPLERQIQQEIHEVLGQGWLFGPLQNAHKLESDGGARGRIDIDTGRFGSPILSIERIRRGAGGVADYQWPIPCAAKPTVKWSK